MKALVQRVSEASVTVDGEVIGAIGAGLCVLVGITHTDSNDQMLRMAEKLWNLRIFNDDAGNMGKSCADIDGEVLIISQFTLYGDTRKGRRPSFVDAARPDHAEPLIEQLVSELRMLGATVATGRFGAHMDVALVNDGPVTLMLEM